MREYRELSGLNDYTSKQSNVSCTKHKLNANASRQTTYFHEVDVGCRGSFQPEVVDVFLLVDV